MSITAFIKERAKRLIHSKMMLTGIGVASFLESTIVPIPLETLLIPLMQSRREKLWLISTITTIGCLIGAFVGYAIGYFIFDQLQDLIIQYIASKEEIDEFQKNMENEGFWFIFSTGVTPVPLQVAMLAAGISHYSLILFFLAVGSSRIIRYFGLAVMVYYLGDKTEAIVRKYKWQVGLAGIAFVLIFIAIKLWL